MNHILVVDDSSIDREVAGHLLRKNDKYYVEFAGNGFEALEHLEAHLPLAVVTDLNMPEMDGMQLVKSMRKRYPNVPVIVMTADGSEELAIESLVSGAADYIPKPRLAKELVESVEFVRAMGATSRPRHRLATCLREQCFNYELENDALLFGPLVEQIQHAALDLSVVDEADARRLSRAVIEVLANAMYHGNLELPAEQIPDFHHAGESTFVVARREAAPFCDRRIHLSAKFTTDAVTFDIRDDGPGFDTRTLVNVTADPTHLMEAQGRGLVLVDLFMDEMEFNAQGNAVRLVKYRPETE